MAPLGSGLGQTCLASLSVLHPVGPGFSRIQRVAQRWGYFGRKSNGGIQVGVSYKSSDPLPQLSYGLRVTC